MKTQRYITDESRFEEVESIGRLLFVGDPGIHDLTHNTIYECIGIRNNLLIMLDDTKDYYLFLPQDGRPIQKGEAKGAGWIVVDDYTGEITKLFQVFDDQRNKITMSKKFFAWLVNKRFNNLDKIDAKKAAKSTNKKTEK